jgi:hypothetical protein
MDVILEVMNFFFGVSADEPLTSIEFENTYNIDTTIPDRVSSIRFFGNYSSFDVHLDAVIISSTEE